MKKKNIIVPQKNVLHGGCGLSNIMKRNAMRYSAILSGLERGNQVTKPQGEWGGNGVEIRFRSRFCKQEKR